MSGKAFLLLLVICLTQNADIYGSPPYGGNGYGGKGHGKHDDHEDDDDDDADVNKSFFRMAGGVVVLVVVATAGAALFSLFAWIVCACHNKFKKNRVKDSNIFEMHDRDSIYPPAWSTSLIYQQHLGSEGFIASSDGLHNLTPYQLIRSRSGTSTSDAARWATGMISGKHVFEITWPWGYRGTHATVGVGTADACLKSKGLSAMIGGSKHTWGLDIVKRRVMHNNQVIKTCPTDGSFVPCRFLMYVDMDEGTIGYGNDVTFWGNVITGLPVHCNKPVFVMVAACKWQAQVTVSYKGSAGPNGTPYGRSSAPYTLPPLRVGSYMYNQDPTLPPSYQQVQMMQDKPKMGDDAEGSHNPDGNISTTAQAMNATAPTDHKESPPAYSSCPPSPDLKY